jgi:hypothetical protein
LNLYPPRSGSRVRAALAFSRRRKMARVRASNSLGLGLTM